MVTRNEFRSDLYYRLNVFPILVPLLRARREGIPELITHFVKVFSHRMRKPINEIPLATMTALTSHSWPGNIRELQNLIERAVILADGAVLHNPLPISAREAITWCVARKTVTDVERTIIVRVLDELRWVIGGANGAAAKLGLKRTTLLYKVKKAGHRTINAIHSRSKP